MGTAKSLSDRRATACDVFVSYRREGGSELAQLVRKNLDERGYSVFVDVHDMPAGPFDQSLIDAIRNCKDVVVLLTPGSLDRCRNEGDWFRTEIATALACGRNVVPLRTAGFQTPDRASLPHDIAALRTHQAVGYSHEHSDSSMEKLCRLLTARPRTASGRNGVLIGAAFAVAAVVIPAAVWAILHRASPGAGAGVGDTPALANGLASTAATTPATAPSRPAPFPDLTGTPFVGSGRAAGGVPVTITLAVRSQSPLGEISGTLTRKSGDVANTYELHGNVHADNTFIFRTTAQGDVSALLLGSVADGGKLLDAKFAVRQSKRNETGSLILRRP